MREAIALLFEHTDAGRVVAITDTRNLAAARLLGRVGMRLERTAGAVFRAEPCEEHEFAVYRPDVLRSNARAAART